MGEFNPNMLSTEFRQGVSSCEPVEGRSYTLTHSDTTAELFLTVGREFAWDQVNATRDEVFARWQIGCTGGYVLAVYVYVYSPEIKGSPQVRNMIFTRELPLALKTMCYGDSEFITIYPELADAPVVVSFYSTLPEYSRIELWGTFSNYCDY